MLLSLKNICLSIDDKKILNNVSFDVKEKEIFGLVGRSGAGKSMTVKSILDYLLPTNAKITGDIMLEDKNLRELNLKKRYKLLTENIAIILQDSMNSLNPYMKIGMQLRETYEKFNKDNNADENIKKMLVQMGLEVTDELLNSYPSQLSGGMKQRVLISMTALINPKIIIADEPTTALDTNNQQLFVELIKKLSNLGMTVIFISHNLRLVGQLCDIIAVMNDGTVVEIGEKEKIFSNPINNITKKMISASKYTTQSYEKKDFSKNEIVFEGKNITKKYGNKTVLDNVDIKLYKGEILGVVGQSGCGKSTLAKIISGIENKDKGQLLLYEQSIVRDKDKFKNFSAIQMVPQNPYSVFDNTKTLKYSLKEAMYLDYFNEKNKKIRDNLKKSKLKLYEKLIEKAGISTQILKRKPHQLSGGELQRLALIRALLLSPDVIIADETVSSLDLDISINLIDFLLELREIKQFSMIFISHDLDMVRRACDRVINMA